MSSRAFTKARNTTNASPITMARVDGVARAPGSMMNMLGSGGSALDLPF